MTKIALLSPEGRVGKVPAALSPVPAVLAGKRIGVLDNGKPGAALLMETLAHELVARTGAVFAGVFKKGSAATPCEPDLLAHIAKSSDLIFTGSAD
jgi:hypothetical protein